MLKKAVSRPQQMKKIEVEVKVKRRQVLVCSTLASALTFPERWRIFSASCP
jgi:hypothetical protein